jgi:hypothetical protein
MCQRVELPSGNCICSGMDRIAEYSINATVCAAQANAASEPFRRFYQALELQWQCLANQAKRENETAAREASVETKAAA